MNAPIFPAIPVSCHCHARWQRLSSPVGSIITSVSLLFVAYLGYLCHLISFKIMCKDSECNHVAKILEFYSVHSVWELHVCPHLFQHSCFRSVVFPANALYPSVAVRALHGPDRPQARPENKIM